MFLSLLHMIEYDRAGEKRIVQIPIPVPEERLALIRVTCSSCSKEDVGMYPLDLLLANHLLCQDCNKSAFGQIFKGEVQPVTLEDVEHVSQAGEYFSLVMKPISVLDFFSRYQEV